MKRKVKIATAAASLILIGVGCYGIYPPLCPLVVGAILWLDLSLGSAAEKRK